jgi:sterol desaturase/sphingolipid hydroxylase (fatty acid hydroxylase superfamily)
MMNGKPMQALQRLSSSRLNGRLGLVFDAATALALFDAGLRTRHAPLSGLIVFAAGLLLFSFVEYAFHRWLFHGPVAAFEQGHRRHHEQPLGDDSLPFFLPPLGMLALAGLFALIVSPSDALLFAAAFAIGYTLYGVGHTVIHLHRFRGARARRWAGTHHVHHHRPHTNFGVTTPLWDIVFGTYHRSRHPERPGSVPPRRGNA